MSTVRAGWSWAESPEEAEEYRAEARGLVGQSIERVRYWNLDYFADRFRHETMTAQLRSLYERLLASKLSNQA